MTSLRACPTFHANAHSRAERWGCCILMFAWAANLWILGGCAAEPSARRPNVLIVVLDTTRADVVSSYRNNLPVTPNFDGLAAEGVRFTRAFTTNFWTLPTHASLFTGLYPSRHGAVATSLHLGSQNDTLAERLGRAGYRTAAFVTNPWLSRERGFGQGFETFAEHWRPAPTEGALHAGEQGAIEAAELWLERQASLEAPFFAFVNLNTAHLPYAPDPAIHAKLAPQPRSIERLARLKKVRGYWHHLVGAEHFDERDFAILRDLYAADVAMVDALLGQLINTLRRLDVLDQTLVIVTADHGENIGDHGRVDHLLSMYDTTIHVPLVMRFPIRIPAGRVDSGLASLIDVFPTVLDAAGLLDAPSLGKSLLSADRDPPEFVVADNERPVLGLALLAEHFPDYDSSRLDGRLRMLRTTRHKLIWHEKTGTELYDLEQDPGETRNLSDEQPAVVAQLLSMLERWAQEHPPIGSHEVVPITADLLRARPTGNEARATPLEARATPLEARATPLEAPTTSREAPTASHETRAAPQSADTESLRQLRQLGYIE